MTTADLPALNAALNSLAAILLIAGLGLIKARRIEAHKRVMLAALAASGLFLTSYLIYHALHGSKHFAGPGNVRTVYLAILLPHTVLAAVNLPFIVVTVFRAWKGRFDKHKKIAKVTWAVWMFVSVTGVIIYLMNYVIWPGPTVAERADRAFSMGLAAHQAQKEATALPHYREAAELGHQGAVCFAAVIADRLEDTETASAAIAGVLARDPEQPSCLILHARRLAIGGKVAAAIPILESVTQRVPSDAFGFATLGFAYFLKYEYVAAAKAFEQSVKLNPEMTANIYNAGYALYLGGDYAAARPVLMRALEAGISDALAERAQRDLDVINGSLWVCPMHAHITGHEGDTCSECGMNLEPLAKGVPDEQWEDAP